MVVSSNAPTVYDDAYYLGVQDPAAWSATSIIPIVLTLCGPVRSVIDVGCGLGQWARGFMDNGVAHVLGMDGEYVNRSLLKIPEACFRPHDLTEPIRMSEAFDLAVCLEVAEHLPASRAPGLVEDLTRLAPIVLFSAALPGQGGLQHINEQYLSYWVELFDRHEYLLHDVVRPRIWRDPVVTWVYRQNIVIFARKGHPRFGDTPGLSGIDYVHPFIYDILRERLDRPKIGDLARAFPGSIRRSIIERGRRLLRRARTGPGV